MPCYRRETALQGGLVMAQNRRLELGDNIYGHDSVKKRKIRAITTIKVKVIDFRINRKPVWDFLLAINSN